MSNNQCRSLGRTQLVETLCHDTQGIHIKTRIRFVQYAEGRLQHGHLEYLVTLLLSARETFVHTAVCQFVVQFHYLSPLAHHLQKVRSVQRLQSLCLSLGIQRRTHKVRHRHTRNLHGLLERQKYTCMRTLLGSHRQKVLPVEHNRALGHFVSRMSHNDIRQRALSRPVLSHQGMHLSVLDGQVYSLQNLLTIDTGM